MGVERWGAALGMWKCKEYISCNADVGQITMEDLQVVEHIVRKDPKVIEECGIIGIPKEDMHKVYCDRELLVRSAYSTAMLTQRKPGRLASTSASAIKSGCSKP